MDPSRRFFQVQAVRTQQTFLPNFQPLLPTMMIFLGGTQHAPIQRARMAAVLGP